MSFFFKLFSVFFRILNWTFLFLFYFIGSQYQGFGYPLKDKHKLNTKRKAKIKKTPFVNVSTKTLIKFSKEKYKYFFLNKPNWLRHNVMFRDCIICLSDEVRQKSQVVKFHWGMKEQMTFFFKLLIEEVVIVVFTYV